MVYNNPLNVTNVGEIWSTYSQIGDYTFGIVLGADLQDYFYVTPGNSGFFVGVINLLIRINN